MFLKAYSISLLSIFNIADTPKEFIKRTLRAQKGPANSIVKNPAQDSNCHKLANSKSLSPWSELEKLIQYQDNTTKMWPLTWQLMSSDVQSLKKKNDNASLNIVIWLWTKWLLKWKEPFPPFSFSPLYFNAPPLYHANPHSNYSSIRALSTNVTETKWDGGLKHLTNNEISKPWDRTIKQQA